MHSLSIGQSSVVIRKRIGHFFVHSFIGPCAQVLFRFVSLIPGALSCVNLEIADSTQSGSETWEEVRGEFDETQHIFAISSFLSLFHMSHTVMIISWDCKMMFQVKIEYSLVPLKHLNLTCQA